MVFPLPFTTSNFLARMTFGMGELMTCPMIMALAIARVRAINPFFIRWFWRSRHPNLSSVVMVSPLIESETAIG